MANQHFLYFAIENAESITTTGQLVNLWTSKRINNLLNELVGTENIDYGITNDTDSGYFTVDKVVELLGLGNETDEDKIVDALNEFIETVLMPEINSYTDELQDYLNNNENKMVWEREVIAPAAIFVAKKRYAMLVKDSEHVRYREPKLKIVGLESKKSSTPQWAKKPLEECYKLGILDKKKEYFKLLKEIENKVYNLSIDEIAIPSGINGIEKYIGPNFTYKSGTPKHVKAAINYNKLLVKYDLKHLEEIKSGSKMKLVNLKNPNPTGEESIGFNGFFPHEFELEKYVDYKVAYEKGFVKPLENFMKSIGWQTEEVVELF